MKIFYNVLWTGFPDGRVEINDVIGQGDKLAVRYTFSGAQKGEFMGIAPTGKNAKIDGMTILKFAGTKCVERWNLGDMMSLMQQLGVIA